MKPTKLFFFKVGAIGLSFLLFFILTSCAPEIEFVGNSFRSGQAKMNSGGETVNILFDSSAGSASIDLSTNCEWTADFVNGRATWCTLSSQSGKKGTATLTISVSENNSYEERSASLVFSHGDIKRTIIVTQKQNDAILLTYTRFEVGCEGGVISIPIRSNIDYSWSITGESSAWIKSVSTKGLVSGTLTFEVSPNETIKKRDGSIIFSGSSIKEVVYIYQDGEIPTLVLSTNEVEVPTEGGAFDVQVRSNLSAEVIIPSECGWVREVSTKTMSTNTYQFTVDENEAFTDREVEILFRSSDPLIEESVIVRQGSATPTLFLGEGLYEIEPNGGTFSVEVSSNFDVSFDIPDSCSWIKPLQTKAIVTKYYSFEVGENETFLPREGIIVFFNKDLNKREIVQVRQGAESPVLTISKKIYDVEPLGGNLDIELSSNMNIEILIQPGCEWIRSLESKTVTTRIHSFSVDRNDGRTSRTAWIVFSNTKRSRSDTVFVSQQFQPILISSDTLNVSGRGGYTTFYTVSPEPSDYRVVPSENWLSVKEQEQVDGKSRFTIIAEPLKVKSRPRQAQIFVFDKAFSLPDTLQVSQYEQFPFFTFTTNAKTVNGPLIEGDNVLGFVSWGDGVQDKYALGIAHSYNSSGTHTVTVETNTCSRILIDNVEDGMIINFRELRK